MWVLLIITLAGFWPDGTPFPSHTAKLEAYGTLKECEDERIRITSEMKEAYPIEEHDKFFLECKPIKRLML